MLGRTPLGVVLALTTALAMVPAFVVMAKRGASQSDWLVLGGIFLVVVALPWTMRTSVRVVDGVVHLRFWFLPAAKIDAASVEGLEVVTFHPLSDFGGWGYKITRKHGRVYAMWGETGVRFRSGKRRYVVSSSDPGGLAIAIAEAGAEAPETLEPVSVREPARYLASSKVSEAQTLS